MALSYGYVYVASISMGANRAQTQKALMEAEAYDGPSIVFAYSPCIAHGIDMSKTASRQKAAVDSGYWPLYRFNPEGEDGKKFIWETKDPTETYQNFIRAERRYTTLEKTAPNDSERLFKEAEEDAKKRMEIYKRMGSLL
jgi:pyruvate-ferredoxin/flavodoxin oxidoreductase